MDPNRWELVAEGGLTAREGGTIHDSAAWGVRRALDAAFQASQKTVA